jgi:hypothetical protein
MWPRLHKTQNQICSPFRKSVWIKHRIKNNGSGSSHDLEKETILEQSQNQISCKPANPPAS